MVDGNATEQLTQTRESQEGIVTFKGNPFADGAWSADAPVKTTEGIEQSQSQQQSQESQPGSAQTQQQQAQTQQSNEQANAQAQTPDPLERLKKLGFDDWDTAEKGLTELRQKAQTPTEKKWANDASKQFYDAWAEGKEDVVFEMLSTKRRIEKAEKLEVTKVSDAQEIIKLSLQLEHKNLSPERIDRLYNRQYKLPEKPAQGLDQTDDEYKDTVKRWETEVRDAEEDIIIAAEIMKTKLAEHKQHLVAPEISGNNSQQNQQAPSQEELAAAERMRTEFLQSIAPTLKEFGGYTVNVKDQDVEFPVSYVIADDERVAMVKNMENLNVDEFITSRWLTKEGKPNTLQIAKDIHLLTNEQTIFQKIANDSASKRLAEHIKVKSNINVTGGSEQGGGQQQPVDPKAGLGKWAFSMK